MTGFAIGLVQGLGLAAAAWMVATGLLLRREARAALKALPYEPTAREREWACRELNRDATDYDVAETASGRAA